MAIRRALLIGLLGCALAGWAGATSRRPRTPTCGGCHETHFTEFGSCTTCHRGDAAALRKGIAHHRLLTGRAAAYAHAGDPAAEQGRALVDRLACRRCHVAGKAGNRLATNLDRVVWQRDQSELERSISVPVENMPRFGLEESQVQAAIAYLLRSAERDRADTTYRVRFATGTLKPGSVFEERCGGCHRTITADGPLGRGSAGPNLAGLLSRYYPNSARGGRGWTTETLDDWIENPRASRTLAAMRPVKLAPDESARLGLEVRRGAAGGDSAECDPSADDGLP